MPKQWGLRGMMRFSYDIDLWLDASAMSFRRITAATTIAKMKGGISRRKILLVPKLQCHRGEFRVTAKMIGASRSGRGLLEHLTLF